ncbi:MAG: metal ABC transporter ATP-binding protein [Pseudomonadota bacterium]
MSVLVRLQDLVLGYGELTLVRRLSMDIEAGMTLAVLGANGAGKSTFVKGLLGLIPPLAGQITWPAGRPRDIGYLAQMSEFDRRFPIRVRDLVAMGSWQGLGLWLGPRQDRHEATLKAMDEAGVLAIADQPLHALSGGQLQRTLFARVILQNAPLVVLDEPFTAVDQRTENHLLAMMGHWRQEGRAIVLVVHDLSSVLDHCDRVLLLGGGIATHGTVESVLTHEHLVAQGYLSESQAAWMLRRATTNPGIRRV